MAMYISAGGAGRGLGSGLPSAAWPAPCHVAPLLLGLRPGEMSQPRPKGAALPRSHSLP